MPTDISYLTQTRKFKSVLKDQLFYNQFEYSVNFIMPEITALREVDHAYIDDTIARRMVWRDLARQRWSSGANPWPAKRLWREITTEMVNNLHAFADFLLNQPAKYKLVVSLDEAWLYSNDLNLLDSAAGLPYLSHKIFSRAVVDRPKDTLRLKKTAYQYRSYFRAEKLTPDQKDTLHRFLASQSLHTRLSPALQNWMADPFTRLQDYFFVDYNAESWVTMLALVQPGLIRKTVQIIPAK